MRNIPKCMSTQHPDNVKTPFFAESAEMAGDDEIQEAYYSFSELGCTEQMWDFEGKEVDNFVVKKLYTKYQSYFSNNRLGEELFLTLRVPNPSVEKTEGKILLETLESIPRSYDAAKAIFDDCPPPVQEVILPMTESARDLDRIYCYYRDFVAGKQVKPVRPYDIKIRDWIGEFKPEKVNVIPLFEDMDRMFKAHDILMEYIIDKNVEYQRVFLARSDPALNYGLLSAVLLNKIALMNLHRLSEDMDTEIYPIVGVGSAPFRGNLTPSTTDRVLKEYPSNHTFTVQSAFKYDNPSDEVRKAIKTIEGHSTGEPHQIDLQKTVGIIEKYTSGYQKQIMGLTKVINKVSKQIPRRRKRKLHIGLFGYSRQLNGERLPRAITFTASLYSLGVPPEILGLDALTLDELEYLKDYYVNMEEDLRDALKYYNMDSPYVPLTLKRRVKEMALDVEIDEVHKTQTDHIVESLVKNNDENIHDYVLMAANRRQFLG